MLGTEKAKPLKCVSLGNLDEDDTLVIHHEPALQEVPIKVLDEGVVAFGLVLVWPLAHLDKVSDHVVIVLKVRSCRVCRPVLG